MAEQQDSFFTQDYNVNEKYDTHSNVISNIVGGTVATVVDAADSIWNSITPEKYNVETSDMLRRIDSNAYNVYNENPDTIHTASFIGGMLAPIGVSMKLMGEARAGIKGASWFSEAGSVARAAEAENVFAQSVGRSSQYNELLRQDYWKTAANALADSAVAEASIVATMNAHPYMEDYMKNPGENFLLGTGIGFGVMAPFALAGRAATHWGARMAEDNATNFGIKAVETMVQPTVDSITEIGMRTSSIRNWQGMLDNYREMPIDMVGPNTILSPRMKGVLEFQIENESAKILDKFDSMASSEVQAMSTDWKQSVIDMITSQPERFAGAETIAFADAKEMASIIGAKPGQLLDTTVGKGTDIPLVGVVTRGSKKGELRPINMIYSPEFDAFYAAKDLKNFGQAADLGITNEAELLGKVERNQHIVPRQERDLEKLSESSAAIDADYLKQLAYFKDMSAEDLAKSAISPHDGPMLQGWLVRAEALVREDPENLAKLGAVITDKNPSWNQLTQTVIKRIQGAGNLRAVPENYTAELSKLTSAKIYKNFAVNDASATVSPRLASEFSSWISGGMKSTRERFSKFLLDTDQSLLSPTGHEMVKEMFDNPRSVAFRNEMAKIADKEGYVYLWRGTSSGGNARGHFAIESYTSNAKKAAEFGKVAMYRVNVNDIVAPIWDTIGKRANEILVKSPSRDIVNGLEHDVNKAPELVATESILTAGKETKITVDINGVRDALIRSKELEIKDYLQQGMALESIALRTNVPLDTVKIYLNGGGGIAAKVDGSLGILNAPYMKYSSASEIEKYLAPEQRSLVLSTTKNKIPLAEFRAKNQANSLDQMNADVIKAFMGSSNSVAAQMTHELLQTADMQAALRFVESNLQEIGNEALGSRMASLNHSLRNMGSMGSIVPLIGKQVTELFNRTASRLITPIASTFESLVKDAAGVVEFNRAININAAIKGYRELVVDEATGTARFMEQSADKPFITRVIGKTPKGKDITEKVRNMIPVMDGGEEFVIKTKGVVDSLVAMQKLGRELYDLKGTYSRILGEPMVKDLGFWVPAFNPRGKYISFVFDKSDKSTRLLWGHTPEQLVEAEKAFTAQLTAQGRTNVDIVRQGEQRALYNKLLGRHDEIFMTSADASAFHSGASATARPSTNANIIGELANGYDAYIRKGVRNLIDVNLSGTMDHLDNLSYVAQSLHKGMPSDAIQKALHVGKDAGQTIRSALLGMGDLEQYVGWRQVNNTFVSAMEWGLQQVSDATQFLRHPIDATLGKTKLASDEQYMKLAADLEARGITNPFAMLDEATAKTQFHADQVATNRNLTPRLVALSNAAMATTMLRVGEIGQAYVNALSLPILTSTAIQNRKAASFMGAKLNAEAVDQFGVIRTMYDGIRYYHSEEGKRIIQSVVDRGMLDPMISEANKTMEMIRSVNPSALDKLEKGLQSQVVNTLSKASEFSEQWVRNYSFATGLYQAKALYPGLSEEGRIIYAANFMDQAIGNYAASQRPVMFQGTLGVAMGLFQTYMVTMAQNMYRLAEVGDKKALLKSMLMQGGLFGASSLPGFHMVSEAIGEHFSDQHFDLETGLYRALPEGADYIIYGIPSNLGPAVSSRGDINPRAPNIAGGFQNLAAVNFIKSAYDSGKRILGALANIGDPGTFHSFAEALSLQTVSRPVARLSEFLLSGNTITTKGNMVMDNTGFWDLYQDPDKEKIQGAWARIFSVRPIQETKIRDAIHLNTVYGQIDAEARQKATIELKSHLRSDTLDADITDRIAGEYMRHGTPSGWRSAINTAIGQTGSSVQDRTRKYLDPRSPTNMMIDNLDGE